MSLKSLFFQLLGYSHYSQPKWSVESVHLKNLVSILHLLVALARHFRAPIRLPENVSVFVVVVQVRFLAFLVNNCLHKMSKRFRFFFDMQKREGALNHRTVLEEITAHYEDVGMRCERDAFDTLFDHAPDKLQVVKKVSIIWENPYERTFFIMGRQSQQ